MIFKSLILCFCLLIDVTLHFFVNGFHFRPELSTLFLLYLALRRPFAETILMLLIFIILGHPFTGLSYMSTFTAYIIMLFLVYRMRGNIFAEAYLTYAVWVFIFSWILKLLMGIGLYGQNILTALSDGVVEHALNSLLMATMTVPFFMMLDRIFDDKSESFYESLFG
jgi:hypothetical protein